MLDGALNLFHHMQRTTLADRGRAALEHARLLNYAQLGIGWLVRRNGRIDAAQPRTIECLSLRNLLVVTVAHAHCSADARRGRLPLDIAAHLLVLRHVLRRRLAQIVVLLRRLGLLEIRVVMMTLLGCNLLDQLDSSIIATFSAGPFLDNHGLFG